MKFFGVVASALLVVSVTARSVSAHSSALDTLDEDLTVPGKNPLRHCANPKDDILDLTRVDLVPNPPKAGQNLTFTAEGTLSKKIEKGAYANLIVKYGPGITLINQKVDLCEQAGNVGRECPLEDDIKLTKEVSIPGRIPPGKYSVQADVYTKDDDKITCLQATVEFHLEKGIAGGLFKQGL